MSELKEKILDVCMSVQLETIKNLKTEVEEAQKAANDYGLPKDRYDSFRTQLLRKRDMFAQQLSKANQQLDLLNQINPEKEYTMVEFGAVIVTNRHNLFISIGLGKVQIDNETYFAISPAVPIYKAMDGKKVEEGFTFNNITYNIKAIY